MDVADFYYLNLGKIEIKNCAHINLMRAFFYLKRQSMDCLFFVPAASLLSESMVLATSPRGLR